jgi:two-component system nitrate/nitrite response regulator NarL
MQRALALGAAAYITKAADPATLVDAIRASIGGGGTGAPKSPDRNNGTFAVELVPLNVESLYPELTSRQAEVFRNLMRGLSDKQIARELGVSDTTIKSHVRAILQIVGVHKRGEAAYQARARGAVES